MKHTVITFPILCLRSGGLIILKYNFLDMFVVCTVFCVHRQQPKYHLKNIRRIPTYVFESKSDWNLNAARFQGNENPKDILTPCNRTNCIQILLIIFHNIASTLLIVKKSGGGGDLN